MSSTTSCRPTILRINLPAAFTKALHEVFALRRSTKHMIQRQLGRPRNDPLP